MSARWLAVTPLLAQIACGTPVDCCGPTTAPLILSTLSSAVESTCGLDPLGAAYCWGDNSSGALGDGTRTSSAIPVRVAGGLTFTRIVSGGGSLEGDSFGDHNCALTPAGAAYCWGGNIYGQLGVPPNAMNPPSETSPVAVTGFSFIMLAAGNSHTCGLTAAKAAFCWGANNVGQLGDSTLNSRANPAPVFGGLAFQSIVAGGDHTCGLTAAGTAYCWGAGQAVGDSSYTNRTTPTPVFGAIHFTSLAAGGGETSEEHTCGIAIDQTAYCWGYDGTGALGAGSHSLGLVPVAVAGGLKFSTLSAAQLNTCGITTGGDTYCWGTASLGQLGTGSSTFSYVPVVFSTSVRFKTISVGAFHVCGIAVDGTVYCTNPGTGLVPVTLP